MSLIHTLLQSQEEIRALRRQNEVLRAKTEVLDIFKAALLGTPHGGIPHTPDVVWRIEAEIKEIEDRERVIGELATRGPAEPALGELSGANGADDSGWIQTKAMVEEVARKAAAQMEKESAEAAPVVRTRGRRTKSK